MNNYEGLIDGAGFGLIADYLKSPRAPIDYLLHVKSKDMLSPLAAELEATTYYSHAPGLFPPAVEHGLRTGTILMSSRRPLLLPNPAQLIDAATIPRETMCWVIYFPPFYCVHTPGLFEGTLIREEVRNPRAVAYGISPRSRPKL